MSNKSDGINSPFNACMYREECRRKDEQIARLREAIEYAVYLLEKGSPTCHRLAIDRLRREAEESYGNQQ